MDRAILQDKLSYPEGSLESWGHINYRVLRLVRPYIQGRVLDVGCARGGYVTALSVHHNQVYGCDLFRWSEWKVICSTRFCQADVIHLPFVDGSFDTVLSLNVLEHIQSVEVALRELRRVCQGRLVLSVPNCQRFPEMEWAGLSFHHWVDRSHVHFFQAQDLEKILVESAFAVELLEPFGTVRPEILLLRSLGVPMIVARGMAWVLQKVPWRTHYAPLLLAVARVVS